MPALSNTVFTRMRCEREAIHSREVVVACVPSVGAEETVSKALSRMRPGQTLMSAFRQKNSAHGLLYRKKMGGACPQLGGTLSCVRRGKRFNLFLQEIRKATAIA
jgi:hypothetical protein